ncbi:MAG: MmcQ/YjbR family DNA-binding protein [Coprococcus sp.]
MRYIWLDEYLLGKRGVTKDLQPDWNWIRYHIGGKMFAAVCLDDQNEPYYINLKLEPMRGEIMRQQYEDIIPGYYSNKVHWNSIKPDGQVPDDLLKDMLDESYRLVLGGFSKKRQREILCLSCCGTECEKCSCYGSLCQGCNTRQGKVFHAPKGKACPIYACAVQKKKLVSCIGCEQLPCDIWRNTRDPQLSDGAFEKTITERIHNLKGI